ncbi:MAG TPA: 4-hydroxythreonine-4-phosphate dehydrogenase PdxA, partial [Stellaceae bacterium]
MLPLAITVGDPAGVGPEITAKALRDMSAAERAAIVVIGNLRTMERAMALAGGGLAFAPGLGPHRDGVVGIIDIPLSGAVPDGEISPAGGEAAFRAVEQAVKLAVEKRISVIVTAPLNKAALHAAGHEYDGHTGLLAALTRSPPGYMLLASEKLSAIHVS